VLTKYLGGPTRHRELPRCATIETLTRRLQEKCAGTGAIHPPDEVLRFVLNGRRIPQGEQKVTLRALDELWLVLLGPLCGGAKKDRPAFGSALRGLRQCQLRAWLPTTATPTATGPDAAVPAPMPMPFAVGPKRKIGEQRMNHQNQIGTRRCDFNVVPSKRPTCRHHSGPRADAASSKST